MVKRAAMKQGAREKEDAQEEGSDAWFASLEAGLRIDEHALDEALIQQPQSMYTVARALALAISRRDGLKQVLKEEEASSAIEYRKVGGKIGSKTEKRATDKEVEAEVALDREVLSAKQRLLDADKLVGLLTALKEAYKDRGYALSKLVDLHLAAYFESDTSTRKPQENLKNARADRARTALQDEYERTGKRTNARDDPPWND